MENQSLLIETLFEKATHYTKTSVELYKLKAIGKSADIISDLASRTIVIAFAVICFFILNTGIALWIGEMLGKTYYGFFIVAGFYAFAGMLFYVFRNRWVKTPLRNSIITQALK